ncbi:MAG: NUDIX domain-containing protein [Chitinispirillaceae bacterium]|nr:NUDIX domain-containing protein [Chitinispirillaceae bacterium]
MEELVAVLSPSGVATGEVVSRNKAHQKGLWHKTVHIWFRNSAGELLLQKRSEKKESHPGLWDISCAGHVSAGDSSISASVREIREELGITINSNELSYMFTIKQQHRTTDNSYIDNEMVDVYLCSRSVCAEDLSPDPEEVSGFTFLSVNLLINKLIKNNFEFVNHEEEYRKLFEIILS